MMIQAATRMIMTKMIVVIVTMTPVAKQIPKQAKKKTPLLNLKNDKTMQSKLKTKMKMPLRQNR